MRKGLFVFLFLCIALVGYTDPHEEQGIVFIGVAGRQSSRKKSIEKALEDAARKAAFYHSVGGRILDVEISGLGYISESHLYYNDDYEEYINELQYDPVTDVIEGEDVFFVRTVYPGAQPLHTGYVKPNGTVRPFWIDDPPAEIGEYPAATAVSGRQSTSAKTIIKSYENAVYSLLQNNHVAIKVRHIDNEGSFDSVSSITSSGILYGFYVVDFWTDPKTKAVWTLAVARSFMPHDYSEENK